MFDISSTKLLILAVVALLVVGPKDFPILLRTIGKYLGIIRRQADEFRTQFNDAMRESELDKLKQDLQTVSQDVEKTIRDAEASVERDVASANAELQAATQSPFQPYPEPASAVEVATTPAEPERAALAIPEPPPLIVQGPVPSVPSPAASEPGPSAQAPAKVGA